MLVVLMPELLPLHMFIPGVGQWRYQVCVVAVALGCPHPGLVVVCILLAPQLPSRSILRIN